MAVMAAQTQKAEDTPVHLEAPDNSGDLYAYPVYRLRKTIPSGTRIKQRAGDPRTSAKGFGLRTWVGDTLGHSGAAER